MSVLSHIYYKIEYNMTYKSLAIQSTKIILNGNPSPTQT